MFLFLFLYKAILREAKIKSKYSNVGVNALNYLNYKFLGRKAQFKDKKRTCIWVWCSFVVGALAIQRVTKVSCMYPIVCQKSNTYFLSCCFFILCKGTFLPTTLTKSVSSLSFLHVSINITINLQIQSKQVTMIMLMNTCRE